MAGRFRGVSLFTGPSQREPVNAGRADYVPIFLSVTQLLDPKERNKAAWLASATAFLVISMFAIGGRSVLEYLNISVPALQGAGGLMLLLVALQLLYGRGASEDAYAVASPEER